MRRTTAQLVRFCSVGASGYGVNLAVSAAGLTILRLPVLAAAALAFVAAASSNFLLNRTWTFRSRDGRRVRQGARFFLVSAAVLGFGLVLLAALVEAGLPPLAAQAAGVAAATPVSFALNRGWTFAPREVPER
jgi:putative flippase GtrA